MTAGASTAQPSWPRTTDVVELAWRVQTFEATVLCADGDSLICAPPPRSGVLVPRAPADAMVRWTDAVGVHSRPAEMVMTEQGTVHVDATGEPSCTQRREYVRAPVAVEITVEALGADGDADAVTGWTSDLSEGGARVFLDGPPPPQGARVDVRLPLSDGVVEIQARVTRTSTTPGRSEVGLTFEGMPAAAADIIRRQVFTAQVEARRNGLYG